MAKFKTVKRQAQKGEYILITNVSKSESGRYVAGDIGTVVRQYEGICVMAEINNRADVLIYNYEYEVITAKTNDEILEEMQVEFHEKTERLYAEINTLKARVSELEEAASPVNELATPDPTATPENWRARIVEQAKDDIERFKNEYGHYISMPPICASCNAEFIVNSEKGTVVALLRGSATYKIRAKGIAKCSPGDVFIEDIGKAIALRRALGIEIPSDYLNVPQPVKATKAIVVNGVEYREVKRKAKKGELVVMLEDGQMYKPGDILEVIEEDRWANSHPGDAISVRLKGGGSWAAFHYEYNVLEAIK